MMRWDIQEAHVEDTLTGRTNDVKRQFRKAKETKGPVQLQLQFYQELLAQ